MAENLAAGLYASAAILLFLAILTTALRCYVRIVILKTFGVDDYLMLLALTFYTVYISWVFYGTHFNGGRHTVDIPLDAYSPSLMAFYMGEVFYVITAFTIKLSIGAFLLRLLKSKAQRTVVYITLGVVTIYSIAYTFMTIFQCSPVDHYWHPTSPGTCFSTNLILAVTYTHTVLLSFSDFLFAAMPIFLVWNLQMNLYMKISVAGLMSLGAIAGVTSIVRVVYIKAIAAQNDLFFESSKLIIWTNLEPGIGIIIGSAAALRPLFKTLLGKTTLFSSSRSRKYGTYGTGSRRRAGTGPWASNHDAHFQLESLKGEEAIGYSTKVNGGVNRSMSKKGIMGTGLGQSDNDSLEELRPTVEEGNILKQTTVERHVEIYDHDGSRAISPRPPPGHF